MKITIQDLINNSWSIFTWTIRWDKTKWVIICESKWIFLYYPYPKPDYFQIIRYVLVWVPVVEEKDIPDDLVIVPL